MYVVRYLLTLIIYFCNAIVIDGVSGVGALISILNPASVAASTVEFPNTAILVFFWSKSGKFCSKDSIPDGLKKTKMS